MLEIPISRGLFTRVDDADAELVEGHKWYALTGNAGYYAASYIPNDAGKKVLKLLHRFLLMAPKGLHVDHMNHDTLDNRRENLRLVSHTQNMWNLRKRSGKTSRFKGVYWNTKDGAWDARIQCNGRKYFIGLFRNEEAAAMAYDERAVELFADMALTNRQMGLFGFAS